MKKTKAQQKRSDERTRVLLEVLHATETLRLRNALIRYHFHCGVYNRDDMKRDPKKYTTARLLREAAEITDLTQIP